MREISRVLSVVVMVGVGTILTGCPSGEEGNPLCTGDASNPATQLGAKIRVMQRAASTLAAEANKLDQEMLATCQAMATELQIPPAELSPPPGGMITPTQQACSRVKAELDKLIKENLSAGVKLTIVYSPIVCSAEASVVSTCVEECDQKTVQRERVTCQPGELSGSCDATCTGSCGGSCTGSCQGSCVGSCDATCTGSCEATCTGTCSGTCNGTCNGECSVKNADGSCAGACNGKCTGSCSGTCTGGCSGKCTGSCSGKCTGGCSGSCTGSCNASCKGSCSVEFKAPKCEKFVYEEVVEECRTTCETEAKAKAECKPPELTVELLASISPAQKAKVDLAVAVLRKHLPTVLRISYKSGVVMKDSVVAYAAALQAVINNAAGAVVQAGACLASAVTTTATAVAQVSVSFEVSASISASASAEGTASAGTN